MLALKGETTEAEDLEVETILGVTIFFCNNILYALSDCLYFGSAISSSWSVLAVSSKASFSLSLALFFSASNIVVSLYKVVMQGLAPSRACINCIASFSNVATSFCSLVVVAFIGLYQHSSILWYFYELLNLLEPR